MGSIAVAFIGAGYFAPKAEACSPPRDSDGNMLPFTCPSHDTVILEEPKEITEDEPRYINDWHQGKVVLIDTRDDKPFVIMETYHHMVDAIRNWKQEKDRISVEDSIGNALDELEWIEEE